MKPEINDLKYIKAAYGFENLGKCAFSSKAGKAVKTFNAVFNHVHAKKVSWIAIFIPKSSRRYRKENGLPDISRYEGYVAAVQELVYKKAMNFAEWGIDERWDSGIPANKIFAFKEPTLHISEVLTPDALKSFYASATSSAAFELNDEQQQIIFKSIVNNELTEIEKRKNQN